MNILAYIIVVLLILTIYAFLKAATTIK